MSAEQYTTMDKEEIKALSILEAHIIEVRGVQKQRNLLQNSLSLRHKQLAEIRAMLRLPEKIQHEAVIRALYLIGETDRRIDNAALPERYQGNPWTQRRHVPSPFDPIMPEDS